MDSSSFSITLIKSEETTVRRQLFSRKFWIATFVALATAHSGTAGAEPGTSVPSFQEYRPTRILDIGTGQSKLFLTKDFLIIRTSTSNPDVAEPVVLAENQVMILGRKSGRATIM